MWRCVELYLATMRAGDVARDRKSQTIAARLWITRSVDAVKGTKNILPLALRHAGAIVVYRDFD